VMTVMAKKMRIEQGSRICGSPINGTF